MQSAFDVGYDHTIRSINEAVRNLKDQEQVFVRLYSFLQDDDDELLGAAAAIEACKTQYPHLSFEAGLDDSAWLCLMIKMTPPPNEARSSTA